MTNITEVASWDENIRQIQRTERVLGGMGGVVNIAASQLANRTQYLKQSLQAIPDYREFTFHITSSDPDGTLAGLAATQSGQTFRVGQGVNADIGFTYYTNIAGVAFAIASFAGKAAYDRQIQQEDIDWRAQMLLQQKGADAQRQQEALKFNAWFTTSQSEVDTFVNAQEARIDTLILNSEDVPLGDYTTGPLTFTAANNTLTHGGYTYKVKSSTVLPFTTSGNSEQTWAVDSSSLRLMSDATLRQELGSTTGATGIGMHHGTLDDVIGDVVTVEQFAVAGETTWEGAIQRAFDWAVAHGKTRVWGPAVYDVKSTIFWRHSGASKIRLELGGLRATDEWPQSTGLWDATPFFMIGDNNGNITNFELAVGVVDGNDRADVIQATGYGFALCLLDIGYAHNNISVVHLGGQNFNTGSVDIIGKNWSGNWLGALIQNGQNASNAIAEGWRINVMFNAANKVGGVWFRRTGQYGRVLGSMDYNGTSLSVAKLSAVTGLDNIGNTRGLRCTNGNESAEFLFYYQYQGSLYVVLLEDYDVQINQNTHTGRGSSFTSGEVLTFPDLPGTTFTVESVTVAGDNYAYANYFDLLHDFQLAPFGKIDVNCGYMAGVIGGNLHSSRFFYYNVFDGLTDKWNGLTVSHSGSVLSFYDRAASDAAFMNVTKDYLNLDRRLYMGLHKITNFETVAGLPRNPGDAVTVLTLQDTATDKYAPAGTTYHLEVQTNFHGTGGSFDVSIIGGGVKVKNRKWYGVMLWEVWEQISADGNSVIGADLRMRQEAQDLMYITITVTRFG
ncbi:hypothetical protein G3M83_06445 [Rouxiella badensis]|uniref:hypothetical protein n=1 Tax=Rouxiella badensis TaxID=1646377 RepID=UPI0013EF19DB|nr:hypothetical protein [Rouxiella badensis]QII37361.1 hypothetical protein G3M83_06445 [Rouxiella badensis]